jgi:foldase protein PrsA
MRGRVSHTRIFTALCAVFISGLLLASCGGGVPGNAVAKVGPYVVSKTLFNHWMQIAADSSAGQVPGQSATTQVPVPPDFTACIASKRATAPKPAAGQPQPSAVQFKAQCLQEYQGLRDQVMQFLISSDWIQGESADQGIKVTAADAQKQLATIKAQQFPTPADFAKFLSTSGMNQNDLLFRVTLDALSNKLRTKVTAGKGTVTTAQIAAYYAKNQSRFSQPERRDLRVVLAKTPADAQAALKAIRSGQSFSTVAKKYSIDQASKSQGGVLLGVAKGQQEPALDAAVFAAQKGALTGPIKTQFGYYIFRVQKITPATQQTLAQVSPTIKQQLSTTNQQAALDAFVKKFRAKWTSRTDCRTGFIVQSCKNAPKVAAQPGLVQTGAANGAAGSQSATPPPQSAAPPAQGGSTTTP